jgi:hypothetical protein
VNWESTLNTNLEGNLTNGEGFANTVTGATNNYALENLNTAAATFNDVYVNLHVVTNAERWDIGL